MATPSSPYFSSFQRCEVTPKVSSTRAGNPQISETGEELGFPTRTWCSGWRSYNSPGVCVGVGKGDDTPTDKTVPGEYWTVIICL